MAIVLAAAAAGAQSTWKNIFWPPTWKSIDDRERIDDFVNDVVAVGIAECGRAILLATPARPEQAPLSPIEGSTKATTWRFRVLPLRHDYAREDVEPCHGGDPIRAASLSRNGTKLIVKFADEAMTVDLTTRALDIPSGGISHHSLAGESFAVAVPDESVKAYDEQGLEHADRVVRVDEAVCRNLYARAALFEAGVQIDILDNRFSPDSPDADRVFTCPGPAGSASDSPGDRVLSAINRLGGGRTTIYTNDEISRLAHQLPADAERRLAVDPPFVTPLGPVSDWAIFEVTTSAALYSPTLEFATIETVLPTDFSVWKGIALDASRHRDLARLSKKKRDESLFLSYQRLRDEWQFDCDGQDSNRTYCLNVHYSVHSFPGSWLIEYWLYYPFDRGQGEHLHDAEHFFVEVDKLGGTVRQAIGAAHGTLSSNNIYRTATPRAPTAELPLFTLVEANKHASAPDIDHDGRFVVGVDANTFHDRAKIWGIRDEGGVTDAHLRAFDGAMSQHTFRVFSADAMPYFADFPDFDARKRQHEYSYTLSPIDWGFRPSCDKKHDPGSSECAIRDIVDEGDAVHAFKALKKSFAPAVLFPRGSWDFVPVSNDGTFSHEQRISLGGAVEIAALVPLEVLKFPGRIGVQSGWALDTAGGPCQSGPLCYGGLTISYERLVTNMYGYTASWATVRESSAPSSPNDEPHTRTRNYLQGGAMFEFAPFPHANIGVQINLAYANNVGLAPRVGVFLSWIPRRGDYGIRASDKSPFF